MSACFLSALDATLVDDRDGLWKLDAPLIFHSEVVGQKIEVPAGFETDFASVPRVPVIYVLYADRNRKAATLHDYLYRNRVFDRSTCDALFREAMIADGESLAVSWAMWAGVRIGGIFAYKRG
jgi:hypothetical protein